MEIITFDIEEWFARKKRYGSDKEKYAILDGYLDGILDKLDEQGIKGTFFCLGAMAVEFPSVIKKIDGRGHEVGCHSHLHQWLNKISLDEVREDTRKAIDSLEQCIGKKVKSYRAPAFSIGEKNKKVFQILAECGIERDASVFPTARDIGGFPSFGHKTPVTVEYGGVSIKEFPICTTYIMGKEVAYSGGGYFRFFPLWFVEREMKRSDYTMTYFHIGDLHPEMSKVQTKAQYEAYFKEPGTLKNRYLRYFKSTVGKKQAYAKLMTLIERHDFVSLEQADRMIDWNSQATVVL